VYEDYVKPLYLLAHNMQLFEDDGTTSRGFGGARHDQTLFSIRARILGYMVYRARAQGPRGIFKVKGEKTFNRDRYFQCKDYKDNARAQENHLIG
jgi:hypothetical protein